MAPQREWFEKDYYAVLGLQKGATEKEITRAYRKLAKQHHPDANAGNKEAEEKFKDISAAYDVLGDAAKRKEYDEVRDMVASGANPFAGAGAGGFGGFGGPGGGFGDGSGVRFETGDMGGLGDLLGNIFGGRGRRGSAGRQPGAGPRRGGDLEAEVHLSFEDAVRGATIAVQLTGAAPCHTCGGKGNDLSLRVPVTFSEAALGAEVKVPTLDGSVTVRIPPGTASAKTLRVRGRGMPKAGGGAGDLLVTVDVVVPQSLSDEQRRAGPAVART